MIGTMQGPWLLCGAALLVVIVVRRLVAGASVIPAKAGIQADDLLINSGDARRRVRTRSKSSDLVVETNRLDPGFRRDDDSARRGGRFMRETERWFLVVVTIGAAALRLMLGIWGPLHVNGQGPLWIRGALDPSALAGYGP